MQSSMVKSCMVWFLALFFVLLAAPVAEAKRSAADQALYDRARKECNNTRIYPSGAIPIINYKGSWFRCHEPCSKSR